MKIIFFGSYIIVYIAKTNTLKIRSIPIIDLRESNEDEGHFFMSLYTGGNIHRNYWVKLSMDDDVVKRVEEI